MEVPVRNKAAMYRLLSAGAFGNTIPQFFSVADWQASPDYHRYEYWGVRSLTPGCRAMFHQPRAVVPELCAAPDFQKNGYNISMMVDAVARVLLFADIYDSPTGLYVYCVENPDIPKETWRTAMPTKGVSHKGLAARMLLQRYLTPSSLADVEAALERWPGHVLELSVLDKNLGTHPGRNHVVWEVRKY